MRWGNGIYTRERWRLSSLGYKEEITYRGSDGHGTLSTTWRYLQLFRCMQVYYQLHRDLPRHTLWYTGLRISYPGVPHLWWGQPRCDDFISYKSHFLLDFKHVFGQFDVQ